MCTEPAISAPPAMANTSQPPVRMCSPNARTPHSTDTSGSESVSPGWAASSRPACIADCSRNIASTPDATIAYSCQLVKTAAIPCS